MKARIRTVSHDLQRYPTTGDWQTSPDGEPDFVVTVSDLNDWRMEALIAIHELIEAVLCKSAEVSQKSVDAFDIAFEKARVAKSSTDADFTDFLILQESLGYAQAPAPDGDDEPGDHIAAPYYKQHQTAIGIERILAAEMGVDWGEYKRRNNALYEELPLP